MIPNKFSILIILILFAGCSKNSGVLNLGRENLMIFREASTVFDSIEGIVADSINEANQHCLEKGEEAQILRKTLYEPQNIFGNSPRVVIYFTCDKVMSKKNLLIKINKK